MIKLSVFMLDPVTAHERYIKEILELKQFSDNQIKKNATIRKKLKESDEVNKKLKQEIRILNKVIAERGLN